MELIDGDFFTEEYCKWRAEPGATGRRKGEGMSDLIRRSAVIDALLQEFPQINIPMVQIALERVSAADAVEVVRCGKCKYWEPMNNGSWMNRNRTDGCCRVLMKCRLAERYNTEKDHFCCYGKRREGNEID